MRTKIAFALFLLLSTLVMGVIGFMFFMDLSLIDALYMTVITVTTVGYREVEIPNDQSKLFIIALILCSVVIVGYAISVTTEYLLASKKIQQLISKRKQKFINKMENHVIICGYGRNGKQAVEKLIDYKRKFIILEINQQIIDSSDVSPDFFLQANANDDDSLLKAGVERASTLIATLPDDADNLFTVLSARQLNSKLTIISRASEERSKKKLMLAGANHVILPNKIGGEHMASLIVNPDLVEFWDNISYGGNEGVNLEQVSYELLFGNNKGCSIIDLNLRQKTGCTIIGYKSASGHYIVNPDPQTILEPGSKIIVVGSTLQINNLQKVYGIEQ